MPASDGMVHAPWTEAEVANLRDWQASGWCHPFTWGDGVELIPTKDGWVLEEGGPVVQTWAHSFMLDGSWLRQMRKP